MDPCLETVMAQFGQRYPQLISRFVAVLTLLLVQASTLIAQSPAVDFGRQILPILAKRCFHCHGPDKGESGLRLNKRDTALAAAESGTPVIVPGDAAKSSLLARITSTDESDRMPPEGARLSAGEIELLRKWIIEGAKWDEHWAFRTPVPQQPPQVKNPTWVSNAIDNFVLAKLEQNDLLPAPPAEKVALLRRVFYDLTGLPPSTADVDAFLANSSPDAYERVVDRLLDSPRYGEHWARHWLDLVRYADTNSFERDGRKPHAWRYRDYVIRSLNDDKPYTHFIREQIAGDELPNPTGDMLVATGFYRLGLWDDEPADRLQARFDELDDIVATTSQVFLGLTFNCARCHDHKIDPISQRDYYGLVAFFQGLNGHASNGPNIERPYFESDVDRAAFAEATAALERRRNDTQTELVDIEQEFRAKFVASQASQRPLEQSDLDDLEYRFYRDHWDSLPDFEKIKPETMGKLPQGKFDTSLATRETEFGFVFTGVLIVPQDGEYTFWLDSDDGSRLLLDTEEVLRYDGIHGTGNPRTAKLPLKAGRTPIRLEYFQRVHGQGLIVHWAGPGLPRRLLSTADSKDPKGIDFAAAMKSNGPELLGKKRFAEYETLRKQLDRLKAEQPNAKYALCVTERGANPADTFVLSRGNAHVPGEKVVPAFPAILGGGVAQIPVPPAGSKSSGRRSVLADWIASPRNGMTARVMVNRIWQHHFGRGLVRSSNNFGQLGDPPTHPELLDYLAGEFVRNGWRLKPLHKLILMSNTYRMSSQANESALTKDPQNQLIWRFDMRRLSAEELRDSIHAVTGVLNLTMYGPGIFPEISAEVLAGQSRPGEGWGKSTPEEQARRSIYIHVKRSLITPLLADFDFADTDSSCAARFATTQPTQALGMLNGAFLNQQATVFAERLRREAGDDRTAQVQLALRLALGRKPDQPSVSRGLALIESLENSHQLNPKKSLEYFCLFVLNLNEFVYLD